MIKFFKETWGFFLAILFIAFIFAGLIIANINNKEKADACQNKCSIFLSKSIDDKCHCKTEKGWEAK